MPATIPVTVFFVGLSVFSSQIPNDCGVKAILPRVAYTSPWSQLSATPVASLDRRHASPPADAMAMTVAQRIGTPGAQPQTAGTRSPVLTGPIGHDYPHVEDHDAVLIFAMSNYDSQVGWTNPLPLPKKNPTDPTDPLYGFVRLDGDRVRFVTNTANKASDLTGIKLPQLKKAICPIKLSNLRPDYLPPYTGAAAVFDLPEGGFTTCASNTASGEKRMDTRLDLNTQGLFVVSASTMKVTKELRLKPDASGKVQLVVGNLPRRYEDGDYTILDSHALAGMPHANVYYAMGANASAGCAMTLHDWYVANAGTLMGLSPCNIDNVSGLGKRRAGSPGTADGTIIGGGGPLDGIQAASFECSNTQWP